MPLPIPVTTTGGYGTVVLGASGLPAGLTLTDNGDGTGEITGTITAGEAANSPFTVTITATDDLDRTSRRVFTFTVNALTVDAIADQAVQENDGLAPTFAPALSINDLGLQVVPYGESTPLGAINATGSDTTGQTSNDLPMAYLGGDVMAIGSDANDTLKTFNVADPNNVTQLGSVGGQIYPQDIDQWTKAGTDYVLVANAAFGQLTLIDVTNPNSISEVWGSTNTQWGGCAFISDTHLIGYRQNSDLMEVYDWSTPSAPTLVGSVSYNPGSPSSVHLTRLTSNYVLAAGGVIDVSDPTTPTVAASGLDLGGGTSTRLTDTLAILDSTPYDMTNPASPVAYTANTLGIVTKGARVDDTHFVAISTTDIRLYDLADPNSPVLVDSVAVSGTARAVTSDGSRAWVMNSGGTIFSYDLSAAGVVETQPTFAPDLSVDTIARTTVFGENELVQPTFAPTPYAPTGLAEAGSYAHNQTIYSHADMALVDPTTAVFATDGTGVILTDFSTPTAPATLGSVLSPGGNQIQSVSVLGDYMAVSSLGSNNVFLYDISTPSSPTLVDTLTGLTGPYGVVLIDSNYLAVKHATGGQKFEVYNWSAAGFGTSAASITASAFARDMALSPNGNFVASIEDSTNKLVIVDVTTRTSPVEVGVLTTSRTAARTFAWLNDNYVAVSGATNGLAIIDVTTKSAPSQVGTIASTNQCGGVAAIDDTYLAWARGFTGGSGTVEIIDWSTPSSPSTAFTLTNTNLNHLRDIVFDGSQYLVVGCGEDNGGSQNRRTTVIDTLA